MPLQPLDPKQWEVVTFADHPRHDTIWTLILGQDGHLYVGLCLEGSGGGVAQLYRYRTDERRLEHLADMGQVTGEPADSGHATQGKIHFSLCQASNGMVYGATHCTTPPAGDKVWNPLVMWDDPDRSFPGGHLFRYDTRTGEAVDFGVITPHDGIPYLLLDEERGRLYGATYPKAHFFRTDLVGRGFTDYGRIAANYPISMLFDRKGNLYTSGPESWLIKYDVDADRLRFLDTRPYTPPWNPDSRASWITDMCLAADGWIYGISYSTDHLFRFDPEQEEPRIEDLGPGLPGMDAEAIRCLVPDRRGGLYYVVQKVMNGCRDSVLTRLDLETGERAPIGPMCLNGEWYSVWRGVCDARGTLYFAGVGRVPVPILVYHP